MRLPDPHEKFDAAAERPQSELVAPTPVRAPLSQQEWGVLVGRCSGDLRYTLRQRVAMTSDVEDLAKCPTPDPPERLAQREALGQLQEWLAA